jgi:erythromycin esterase-like protein
VIRFLSVLLLLAAPLRAQDAPAADWIRSHAVRLATPEATHGSREFFQLKHRMLEFLVTQMGFGIFSIEANMTEAHKLNGYVLNGQGDPAKLIQDMYFWTWNTQEVLAMVRWMREYNRSGKDRVEFTGFDMQTPTGAAGIARDFVAKADPEYGGEFATAEKLSAAPSLPRTAQNFGVATATFPVEDAVGKRVRFRGFIRTGNVAKGYAGLWWRVDGPSGVLAFDNMQSRGVTGPTPWTEYTIELPVASDATNINFGALFPGEGTAWFDSFTIELDGKPYRTPRIDLDFETLNGYYAGGNGYAASLDDQIVHSGKHSLRLAFAGAPKAVPGGIDPREAVAAWKQVVQHLESSREAYAKKGLAPREIEWAVQNARVVLQCMQMRSGEVSRDSSMAANVKWILDQNPTAKIVLWAHNGHVTRQGSYGTMGSALSKIYGPAMVVFGFAFNQGSFQAVSQEKHLLKDFTVPPAPAGSFDAVLAAAGPPLFALDLRGAPAPAASWLASPHASRSIGAIYYENQPFALMGQLRAGDSYDAILFVERTSAARPNLGIAYAVAAAPSGAREFTDPEYGIRFTLPSAWTFKQATRWGDREATLNLDRPDTPAAVSLYYRPRGAGESSAEDGRRRTLSAAMDAKIVQRTVEGLSYRARPDSCLARTVSASPARSCIGEFTSAGTAMAEYLTWVETERAHFLVFGRVPQSDLERYRKAVDGLLEAVILR